MKYYFLTLSIKGSSIEGIKYLQNVMYYYLDLPNWVLLLSEKKKIVKKYFDFDITWYKLYCNRLDKIIKIFLMSDNFNNFIDKIDI